MLVDVRSDSDWTAQMIEDDRDVRERLRKFDEFRKLGVVVPCVEG